MTEFAEGKSYHKLPSKLEWAKREVLRQKVVWVPPHLRKEPEEARHQLYGLPIPKKKTVLEEMKEEEQKKFEEQERKEKERKRREREQARDLRLRKLATAERAASAPPGS